MKKDNSPYSLFPGPDGRWGTKDKEGNIYDAPVYIRSNNPEKENLFHDESGLEVVEFDEKEGFIPVVWSSGTWWDEAFMVARYPKEFDHFILPSAKVQKEMCPDDIKDIQKIKSLMNLSLLQLRVLEDIEYICNWEAIENREEAHNFHDEWWIRTNPEEVSCDDRVNALIPIMKNPYIPDNLKTTMWYGLFVFNDYFSQDAGPSTPK